MAPLYNLVEIVEDHGVRVFSTETSDRFDGISAWVDDIPVIAVNVLHDSVRRRFTVAHELGHILLEFDDEQDSREREKHCLKMLFFLNLEVKRDQKSPYWSYKN